MGEQDLHDLFAELVPNTPDVVVSPEARCPRCGETAANHGNYATGEDWTCPDQDGYGKRIGSDHN